MNLSAPGRRTCWGVFTLCLTTLMYELILTRIFSVLMWYHFASMAISLALFGMGVAALVVYLRPRWFPPERTGHQAACFAAGAGLSVALLFSVFVLFRLQPQVAFRVLSFFHQPFYQPFQQGFYDQSIPGALLLVLAVLYLVTALPFFFAGLSLTLLLSRYLRDINRLYCFDLLGAGSGCLLVILVLKLVGGVSGLLVIALCGLLAGLLLTPAGSSRRYRGGLLVLALLLAGTLAASVTTNFAEIRFVRGRYEPNLLWSAWNSFSRVAVYPSQSQEMNQAWGLSRTYHGPIPDQLGMVVDDTGYTTMYRWEGEQTLGFFRDNVIALAYRLKQRPTGLVIGPGGGKDVLAALASGASHVVALEINPLVAKAVNQKFAPFTGGLYHRPDVELVVDEGRSYIRRSDRKFDVIQASAVFGRMAPSAGAFTLSENNLYTVEAFRDYWNHLHDDGILTISRFIFERESLRLVSLGMEFLRQQGVADPAAHIAVIRERGLANFMLKKSPFTPEEVARLRRLARDLEFQVVFLPDQRSGDDSYHQLIASGGSEQFFTNFPFDIRPTSDDKPFFYYMYKPADFLRLFSFPKNSRFEDRAVLILRNLLVVVSLLVGLFILGPLLLLRRRILAEPGAKSRILYFACLGLGFMLLEIGLLRRFILFLGPPIYALAVILFSLLVFSGLGSLLANRAGPGRERRLLLPLLLALVLLNQAYSFGLPSLLSAGITLPLLLRCLFAALLLAPLGLLLGMPLPLGMRLFHPDPHGVAWSWGINSATSVLGALLAVVVAMNAGYTLTLVAGSIVYLVAWLAVLAGGPRIVRIR